MSAFNILTHTYKCPKTGEQVTLRIQFKYGNTWQIEYHMGDVLKWGGNDVGQKGKRKVTVDAISEECSSCHEPHEMDVLIERDRLTSVAIHIKEYDYMMAKRNYIILED